MPFHLWSPDVYEGAPTPVTGLMASIVKVGAFAALIRVLISALGTQLDTWRPILLDVDRPHDRRRRVASRVVQRNVKRMLAYSSINHAGFILLGVWAGTIRGTAATLFYVITYAPVVVATFAIVTLIGGVGDEHHSIERYQGLARRQPWLGAALAVLLLSQLGAPLTTGFYAKFAVLASVVDAGGGALALIALLSAAIAAFFYLRWAMALYSDDGVEGTRVARAAPRRASSSPSACCVTLVFGVWPGPLVTLAQHATVLFTP